MRVASAHATAAAENRIVRPAVATVRATAVGTSLPAANCSRNLATISSP